MPRTTIRNLLLADPQLAGHTFLIVHRLKPRMNAAVRFAGEKYPNNEKKMALFVNGATYGVVSSFLHDNVDDVDDDMITRVTACAVQFLDLLYSPEFNGDWDLLA